MASYRTQFCVRCVLSKILKRDIQLLLSNFSVFLIESFLIFQLKKKTIRKVAKITSELSVSAVIFLGNVALAFTVLRNKSKTKELMLSSTHSSETLNTVN